MLTNTQTQPYKNWVHLDMKGMMPSEARLCRWLQRLAAAGFSAVVLEYEDRIPWQTWPGTYRPGLDLAGWKRVWETCRILGLEVVPLIQTYGHLEWLLKHEQWAHLRCAGHQNLVNPQCAEVKAKLDEWIKDVLQLHPESRHVHVGLDEVYNMGAHRPGSTRQAVMKEFAEHAAFVCGKVIDAGRLPIIWGDMFLSEDALAAASSLPKDVIVCDWKYMPGLQPDTARFAAQGRRVMAASALRKSPSHLLMEGLDARITNVQEWQQAISSGKAGTVEALIHTVWARGRSLSPMYGPWEPWGPVFDLAGRPQTDLSEPIRKGLDLLNRGMQTHLHMVAEQASLDIRHLHGANPWEEEALRWWELALRHYTLIMVVHYRSIGYESIVSSMKYQGHDPLLAKESQHGRKVLLEDLNGLKQDMTQWLERNEWSDIEEFLDGRIGNLLRVAKLEETGSV